MRDALLRLAPPGETASGTDYLEPDEVDGVYRKTGINPGKCLLHLLAPDVAPQSVPLTLLAGERRELDVVAEPGVAVVFEVRCRLDAPPEHGMLDGQLFLHDARGECVVALRLWPYCDDQVQRIKRVRLGLLAGTYRVQAEEFGGGKKKEFEIVVPAAGPPDPIVIDLR